MTVHRWHYAICITWAFFATQSIAMGDEPLRISWKDEMLTIQRDGLPGGEVKVWYLEAFCRPGSTRRDWKETVIPHRTRLLDQDADRTLLKLRSELNDGVVVDSEIRTTHDEVDFRVVATNPGRTESQAHWAQPCIRVDRFTGTPATRDSEVYLPSCFVDIGGKSTRLPTQPWATEGFYTPGQVWCPIGVSRDDVNPRPLSKLVPSSGLIGCVSRDGKQVLATAWEPYQELFQGVIVCIHSDFRIGGLRAGESKTIRGKIYIVPADFQALHARYERDFPEHRSKASQKNSAPGTRRLIEFGWDEPDTGFLKRHQAQVERAPFDGCVYHVNTSAVGRPSENFTWLCWGTRRFADEDFETAFKDLRSLDWKRFTHNFLRFNVTPGDVDWFDDHGAILANARVAARLARAGRGRGILLDTEQYQGQLFDYAKQRHTSEKTWDEYAAQVRRQGREFMAALQEEFPGITVLTTFGPSLVQKQGEGGRTPLQKRPYGLLIPFFDGMIEAVQGLTRIVDGHELSYGFREPEQFERANQMMIDSADLMADSAAYRRTVSPAFGLWLDYDWRNRGWRLGDLESNHFSPRRFQTALRAALQYSNEYVWIYTETPRWWTDKGERVALPWDYVAAIEAAREGRCPDLAGGESINDPRDRQ